MIIKLWNKNETVVYAAEELKKYLDMMDAGFCEDIVVTDAIEPEKVDGEIKFGLLEDFGLDASDVADHFCDDVVYIDINNGSGIIAGSNVRSILLSVYTYLKEAGCAFIRPGKDGEIIPKRDMASFSYTYRKKADYPFRGECIEGAPSIEHLAETIIWSPKVGMNMFMIEQIVPYNYISRWYKHTGSTVLEDENVPYEEIAKKVADLELLIKKCGLQFHALGHGYLLEPYGIRYITADMEYHLSDEARQDIAFCKGKRDLIANSPNFTHLCYSNEKVRKKLVDWIVGYMREKPHIDFLHLWLADAQDNHCECPLCIDETTSDQYVKILNEVDEEFTRLGIDTKIVFILYVETMWAPIYEKIKNPDRFYMMTAIGGRDFRKPLDKTPYQGETPPYKKNNYDIRMDFPLSMRFTDEWRRAFDGRLLLFEYNMYINQYDDPGFMNLARVWYEEAQNLENLNVHGTIDDQTPRSYFPNALPMSIYGEAMFDKSIDFDSFCEKYFKNTYGRDYKLAFDYLSSISNLMGYNELQARLDILELDPDLGSTKKVLYKPWLTDNAQANFSKVIELTNEFESIAKAHYETEENPVYKKSWKLLFYHTDFCRRYAQFLIALSLDTPDEAQRLYNEMIDVLSKLETEISLEFDLFLFDKGAKRKF